MQLGTMRTIGRRPKSTDYMEIRNVWATDIPTLCTHLGVPGPWIVEGGIVVVVGGANKAHPLRHGSATLVSADLHTP